jgi:uncharacterized protein (DUF427 family)
VRPKENVWEYPRPPRVVADDRHVRVVFGGTVIADTRRAHRVLETTHPPTWYLPAEDVRFEHLVEIPRRTNCEWKGFATYFDVRVGDRVAPGAAWCYRNLPEPFAAMRDAVAFYASMMDECTVDGERVRPQPGGFYGGWITAELVGPFKGEPGSDGW